MIEEKLIENVEHLLEQQYTPFPTKPFESGYLYMILSYLKDYSQLLFTLHLLKKYFGYEYEIVRGIASIINGILAEEVVLIKDGKKVKTIRYKDTIQKSIKAYITGKPNIEIVFPYAKKIGKHEIEITIPIIEFDDLMDASFYVPFGLVDVVEENERIVRLKIDTNLL